MISKTYYRYIWLLDTLLNSCPLTIEEINMLWDACPASDGRPIPLRTFHEQRKGIKEMFGVEIVCDRSHGNVYYVKNPEVLEKQKVAKWLLHKYSIPQEFATFNSMKDRILLEEIPLGTSFLDDIIEAMQKNVELQVDYQRYENDQEEYNLQEFHIQPYALKVFNRRWYLLGFIKEKDGLRTIAPLQKSKSAPTAFKQNIFALPRSTKANLKVSPSMENFLSSHIDYALHLSW